MTDFFPFGIHDGISMTRNTFVHQLEGTELAGDALFLLPFQFGTVGKVLAIDKLGNPSESGFDGRSGVVQVVAI